MVFGIAAELVGLSVEIPVGCSNLGLIVVDFGSLVAIFVVVANLNSVLVVDYNLLYLSYSFLSGWVDYYSEYGRADSYLEFGLADNCWKSSVVDVVTLQLYE